MRKTALFFVFLLGIGAPTAQAQGKRWDAGGTVGWSGAKPSPESTSRYDDDWYGAGRYAALLGYYWTEHLKTEVEYANSGEGALYRTDFRTVAGSPTYPYNVETFHRLDQVSARIVWQFGRNAWVHPYLSGGIVAERDRTHTFVPPQYQYPNGGSVPVLVMPAKTSDTITDYRAGLTAGAGAKVYMSQRAFFNTGIVGTWSHPAQTISAFAGFGIDF